MNLKYTQYYDSAKSLSHCEFIIEQFNTQELPPWGFELLFNAFIVNINQAWELAHAAYKNNFSSILNGRKIIDRVYNDRTQNDDLLNFIREARNQLSHREAILWSSDEEPRIDCIGKANIVGPSSNMRNKNSYSCAVLPSLNLNFTGTQIALKPIMDKKGTVLSVPVMHLNHKIQNDPINVMNISYEYYGVKFSELVSACRE